MPVAEVARQMLDAYPRELNVDRGLLVSCIEACSDCAESCTQCADDCLGEEIVQELTTCIRLNLDCADVCATTGRVVSRRTGYDADGDQRRAQSMHRGVPHLRRRVRDPTPRTEWSTAGSARRSAVAASRRANSCSPRSPESPACWQKTSVHCNGLPLPRALFPRPAAVRHPG